MLKCFKNLTTISKTSIFNDNFSISYEESDVKLIAHTFAYTVPSFFEFIKFLEVSIPILFILNLL